MALSPVWRGLYEYAAYLAALGDFRVLIGLWLLAANPLAPAGEAEAQPIDFKNFELVAGRTLGEGMLLIDMHEHLRGKIPVEGCPAVVAAACATFQP